MRYPKNAEFHKGILISRVPVAGFAGLLFTIATAATFLSLPAVREFTLAVSIAVVPTTLLLHIWRTQTRW